MSSTNANTNANQQTQTTSNVSTVIQNKDTSSWKSWFESRDSVVQINKGAQELLFKQFDSTVDLDKCKSEIMGHIETVFLFRQNFGNHRVNLFHHLTSIGGNIYQPSADYGFIQGIEESASCFLTPDVDMLVALPLQNPEPIPVLNNLLAVTSINEVDALTNGQQTTFTPRNFIPVPPFLVTQISSIISEKDGNAKEVLIEVARVIKEFDTKHSNDAEYTEKARQKCRPILAWLFLTIKEKINAIPTMGCNNRSMIRSLKALEDLHLNSSKDKPTNKVNSNSTENLESIFKRPLEILATSSSATNDFVQKLSSSQAISGEKVTRSFKKIAPKYQRMLLVASSQGEVVPSELSKEAMEFFAQSSVLHAQIFLNSLLESERIECSVSPAMTTSLMHGSFLWASALTPSGLAPSVISSLDFLANDTLQEGIVLDYSTKFEISSVSLQKLTKSQVLFPVDIEALIERLKALEVLVRLFFGHLSPAQQGLKRFINLCMDNKRLLKTKLYLDDMFIAKLIFAVDDRLNQWLHQCCRVEFVTETSLNLIDFSSIISDLQLCQFNYILPPNIAKVKSDQKEDKVNLDKEKDLEREAKKRKVQSSQVKNQKMVQDWKLRQNEQWNTIFKNKSKEAPVLSVGSKLCLKYHCKGICYSDCPFKLSHCTLVDDDKLSAERYIKSLRGE